MEAKKRSISPPLPFELLLRIRHPSVDPAELSRELGLAPRHFFRAGDPREKRTNFAPVSTHPESYWLGSLDATSWPADSWLSGFANLEFAQKEFAKAATRNLGSALSFGAIRYLRANAALFKRIRDEGGRVSLLVSLSSGAVDTFSLTPEVTRVFSELSITIEFEITNA
jgi:hypothetical protein